MSSTSFLHSTIAGLTAALILIPGGFFAGGVAIHGGDPSPAVLAVPAGFVALVVALLTIFRSLRVDPDLS